MAKFDEREGSSCHIHFSLADGEGRNVFAGDRPLFESFLAGQLACLRELTVLLAPNIYGTFFFGKITIALYWFLQVFFLAGSRIAYRYFRYTRTLQHARREDLAPTIVLGPAADAEVPLRGIESGALKRIQVIGILSPSRADRSQ